MRYLHQAKYWFEMAADANLAGYPGLAKIYQDSAIGFMRLAQMRYRYILGNFPSRVHHILSDIFKLRAENLIK